MKTSHLLAFTATLLIVSMLFITSISAFEFDNVQTNIELTKGQTLTLDKEVIAYNDLWEKYKPIEIKNAFGLGDTLFKGALIQHDENCGTECKSTMQIYTDGNNPLIDAVEFYTIDGENRFKQNVRSYQFYINTGSKQIEIEDYKYTCSETGKVFSNGTKETICSDVLIGTHLENSPIWIPYNLGEILQKGTYEVKLEANKKSDRTVDWVITTQGKVLSEWATWGGTVGVALENNLQNYYKLDEVSGTTANDEQNNDDLTNSGGNLSQSGILGTSYLFDDTGAEKLTFPTGKLNASFFAGNLTINMWLKPETWNSGDYVFFGGAGGDVAIFYNSSTKIGVNFYTGASYVVSAPIAVGGWNMITITKENNGNGLKIYANGTLKETIAFTGNPATSAGASTFAFRNGVGGYNGYIDEIGIWTTNLSASNISALYNSGSGAYPFGGGVVTLNSPANASVVTNPLVTFNATATLAGGANLTNMSLWTNSSGTWIMNNRTSKTGKTNTSTWSLTIPTGTTKWNVQACDTDGDCGFSTANYTITLDSTAPTIAINAGNGTQNYGSLATNHTINFTATDTGLSTCWINYNGTNRSVSCTSGNLASYSFNLQSETYSAIVYANDTAGNLKTQAVSWNYNIFVNNTSYSSSVYALSTQSINISGSYNYPTITSVNAYLNYDGVIYPMTTTLNAGTFSATTSFSTGSVVGTENFNFTFYTPETGNVTSSSLSQTILSLPTLNASSTVCPAGTSPSFIFKFGDETNLSTLNANANYIVNYGTSTTGGYLTLSGNYTNISNFSICMNNSSPSYYVRYGEVLYNLDGYTQRHFYIFQNTRVTNESVNNTLYMLPSASATGFKINAISSTVIPYENYFIGLLRWYPNLNQYYVVEMGKTDNKGDTGVYVKTQDVDYRIALYSTDGTLINMINSTRLICQEYPCLYNMIVTGEELDLTTRLNVQADINYDSSSKTFTFTWNDPSQETSSMNFLVYKEGITNTMICNQTTNSFTGVMTCNVSGYSGTIKAEAFRYASPGAAIAQWVEIIGSYITDIPNASFLGLFFGFLTVTLFALIGIYNPVIAIVLGVIGLLPLLLLGNISIVIFSAIAIMGGIVVHFLRRIS
jgi:hypothetical protein